MVLVLQEHTSRPTINEAPHPQTRALDAACLFLNASTSPAFPNTHVNTKVNLSNLANNSTRL
jgi:hypothetical protein